jgi:hypothetical protein
VKGTEKTRSYKMQCVCKASNGSLALRHSCCTMDQFRSVLRVSKTALSLALRRAQKSVFARRSRSVSGVRTEGHTYTCDMQWTVEKLSFVEGHKSVSGSAWHDLLLKFGIRKEDSVKVIKKLVRTLLDELENLFRSYWGHRLGVSDGLLQVLGHSVRVRTQEVRDRPLPRFHLLQHVNAKRGSIYCKTRQ